MLIITCSFILFYFFQFLFFNLWLLVILLSEPRLHLGGPWKACRPLAVRVPHSSPIPSAKWNPTTPMPPWGSLWSQRSHAVAPHPGHLSWGCVQVCGQWVVGSSPLSIVSDSTVYKARLHPWPHPVPVDSLVTSILLPLSEGHMFTTNEGSDLPRVIQTSPWARK